MKQLKRLSSCRCLGQQLARVIFSRLLPVLVLVLGLGLTAFLGNTLRQNAQKSWKESAERETTQGTAAMLGWINERLTTLSGVLLLVENSDTLESAAFYSAMSTMETQGKAEQVSAKAVMDYRATGWVARYSTADPTTDSHFPAQGKEPPELLLQTLNLAMETPDNWYMSAPYVDASGKGHVYVAIAPLNRSEVAVAAVLDLEQAFKNLMDTRALAGVGLVCEVNPFGSKSASLVYADPQTGPVAFERQDGMFTARARFKLRWIVTDAYAGGANYTLAYGVWAVGVLLSLSVALYVVTLRNTNMRIQKRVDEATENLKQALAGMQAAEQVARIAKDAAEEATKAKSDFLANMSHEIRTPMNAIIGLSGLALKNEMPPRLHDYLSKIKRSGEHLLGIINDILDFSKIESGKLEVEAIPFELESVLDNVVNLIAEKVSNQGLELLSSVDANIPKALIGDPLRLGQILINYANNAVKFTQQGCVRMSIAVQEPLDGEVMLRFSVTDTGIGLTQAQMGKLFQSFVQADTSTTRNYGGTGLGLAVSKSLAEAMGGEVGVTSEVGQGSTFWFTARLGVGSEERIASAPSIDLRGRSVLVVDDNESSALILHDMFAAMGFAAAHVNSGMAALDALNQAEAAGAAFEFVLVDWLMPDMDGLETVRALQALPLEIQPSVLMVTAQLRPELSKGAQELEIQHVLVKPISHSVLFNTMMQIMGHAPTVAATSTTRHERSNLESKLDAIGGARILLVEDNEINQQVACELLREAGFEVDVAENGQVAVHFVEARSADGLPFDIVLMDMQMPVMDGVTASRLVRNSHSAETLPIVAMTANAMKVDRDRCIDAGMNGFVTKPINPEELWQALLTWVQVRPGMGPIAPKVDKAASEPADAQTDVMQRLRGVDGLDVDLGLSRTTHNPAFYASMLKKFVASQEDAMERIGQALQSGDNATAERHAHTLKGVSSNLGASSLQHAADQLERALREDAAHAVVTEHMRNTATLLGHLVLALKAVPGLVETTTQTDVKNLTQAEKDSAVEAVGRIRMLLQDNDPQAAELWESHAVALRALYAQADQIEAAIQSFDFDAALDLLSTSALER